jgi:aryl-alcohol dehydrogenase-like predicted oxidoreductase
MHILKSRIVLGTVQFGMSYGVSNQPGKTIKSDVVDILNYAHNNGINYLDTASAYGDSEIIIGELANKNHWRIITKVPSIKDDKNNNCKLMVKELFYESLNNLNRDSIDSLLIHSCDDLFTNYGRELFEAILELKDDKKVSKIGVSVYNKNQIDRLLRDYDIDTIQIPINILDQRLIAGNYLSQIKDCGLEVHARSIFLQGLLLMSSKDIPPFFKPITKQLKLFQIKAREMSISTLSLALSYVFSLEELDYILIGVNNLKQLKEILETQIIETSIDDYYDLAVFDEQFVNPSRWVLN